MVDETSTTAEPAGPDRAEPAGPDQAEPAGPEPAEPESTVHVRWFAGARVAAGTGAEDVRVPAGLRVTGLRELLAARGEPLARVLAVSTLLVDAVAAEGHETLRDGASVDVLPPFAGG